MKKEIMWGVWLVGGRWFCFCGYAENKVKGGMEDVKEVVDLSVDSLNKGKRVGGVGGCRGKGDNGVVLLVGN